MRFYRTMLGIFYVDRIRNKAVRNSNRWEPEPLKDFKGIVKEKELKCYGNFIIIRVNKIFLLLTYKVSF